MEEVWTAGSVTSSWALVRRELSRERSRVCRWRTSSNRTSMEWSSALRLEMFAFGGGGEEAVGKLSSVIMLMVRQI